MAKITARRLRELLDYNPRTGQFTWRVNSRGGGARVGKIAGTIYELGKGYYRRRIGIDGHDYHGGRLAFLWMTGRWPPPSKEVDHKNGDATDDRWSNLRLATHLQNIRSQKSQTPFKGVTFDKWTKRYKAQLTVNGHNIYLGRFDSPKEAHAAYCTAAKRYFGTFARFT